MTNKIFTYLFSFTVIAFMTQSCVMAISEAEQWLYVSNVIQAQEQELATFANKLGSCLNDNAAFFSMPVGAVAALVGALRWHQAAGLVNFRNRQAAFFLGGISIGTTGALTGYFFCKAIGLLLKDWPARCKKVLTAYVAEWQINKPNTPEVLHPMFETMHAEFMKSPNISSITDQQACQIVESLLAVSVVVVAAK